MSLLAVYLFLFVLCVPPIFVQLKLGNHQQKGVVKLLSTHIPIFKGKSCPPSLLIFNDVHMITHKPFVTIQTNIKDTYFKGPYAGCTSFRGISVSK